jgi:predicted metallo-beta-lactamase superfamily hydrolase
VRLEILAAESLGVRGLCCRVEAGNRVVVIDPGIALGLRRYGLPPHPLQVAVGRAARRRIVEALEGATDVVFSHFHGDHVPLVDANPYQLAFSHLPPNFPSLRAWSLSPDGQTLTSQDRARELMDLFGPRFRVAEEVLDGPLSFSPAMPHGVGGPPFGNVMLTRVDLGGRVFVHASDIQLLDNATIDFILDWEPDWVLAAGPPLYHRALDARQRARAWFNARCLAAEVGTLILDHHLMRSLEGQTWLEKLSLETGRRVYCAADFMGRPRRLLEAQRREIYTAIPVRAGWHEGYARGVESVEDFAPPVPRNHSEPGLALSRSDLDASVAKARS